MATILIVDDHSVNRKFLTTLLRYHGHRLLEAADGSEGLAVVQAKRPDLVITDVLMPVMDGYEFVRRLRLDPATSRIPVVFYTAHFDEPDARGLALSGGVSDVLGKSAPSADVIEIVERVLSGAPETLPASGTPLLPAEFEAEHLRLLTDKLSQKVEELETANARLRLERHRAHQYLDTAEVILLELDTEGRVVLVNRYACSVLGWTTDELVGRDWVDSCIPLRIRDSVRRHFYDLLGDGPSVVENAIVTRSGEERLIEWRNTLLHDDEGHVIGTLSSGTDITERTRTDAALRTAEERMRFALQSAAVGIWDMDYPTGVLRWSETMAAQYGMRPDTFGGTLDDFVAGIHPDDRASVLEVVEHATKTGADFSVHHRSLWPDGTVRWLSGAGRIYLGADGEPVRGVGISLDITERRLLDQQYQQAHKMEAVGRLASGVAHDFNNLLTVILGYCDLLRAELAATDPRQADVMAIQNAGQSAARLTHQLLAFSRKEIIVPTLIDVNDVVADMRSMFARLIEEDVNIVLRLGPARALVTADHGQVEQIILNLAVNARDAMPQGGTLTIETGNVELDESFTRTHLAAKPGPYVVLTVTDTGTGMTPHVQAHLFEPFFTTKEATHGTGLGLATVHGIVTRSGGSISVYSEVGRGTSFKVYFPRANAAAMAGNAPPEYSPRP
jgi:PAS domain S-box-containing protein